MILLRNASKVEKVKRIKRIAAMGSLVSLALLGLSLTLISEITITPEPITLNEWILSFAFIPLSFFIGVWCMLVELMSMGVIEDTVVNPSAPPAMGFGFAFLALSVVILVLNVWRLFSPTAEICLMKTNNSNDIVVVKQGSEISIRWDSIPITVKPGNIEIAAVRLPKEFFKMQGNDIVDKNPFIDWLVKGKFAETDQFRGWTGVLIRSFARASIEVTANQIKVSQSQWH